MLEVDNLGLLALLFFLAEATDDLDMREIVEVCTDIVLDQYGNLVLTVHRKDEQSTLRHLMDFG